MRAVILTALLVLLLPAGAGSTVASGLRGHVTIGPLTPVCKAGTPCSGPAKNVSLWFRHVFKITQATTDGSGNYRIGLGPGTYLVSSPRGMSIRPVSVTVVAGRMRIVNFAIDTGIR